MQSFFVSALNEADGSISACLVTCMSQPDVERCIDSTQRAIPCTEYAQRQSSHRYKPHENVECGRYLWRFFEPIDYVAGYHA